MTEVDRSVANQHAEEILLPNEVEYRFLDNTIAMKPVPIAVAKELRRFTDRLSQLTSGADDQVKENWSDVDIEAAGVYVKAALRLLSHYKVTLSQEQIESLPLKEIQAFLQKQLDVQGEEDFLLEPLRRTITHFSGRKQKAEPESSKS